LAERKLVELNQLKNKFLGIAAHDLRNPLSSIRGFSEILLSEGAGPLSEEQKEFLTIIYHASEGMLALVNNLLDISVIESGKLDLQLKRQPLQKLLAERLRMSRIIGEKKQIGLQATCEEIPDVLVDGNRIAQVIDNLIGNALKFSPPGSMVYITLRREGEAAKISVRDQGPGISPQDQAKMFGEFQRLSAKPTGGEKSSGLGLAIVKKIVEAHKGSLGVESQLGLGSTFFFTIPITTPGKGEET
jgi:signal transduction histidine kinase